MPIQLSGPQASRVRQAVADLRNFIDYKVKERLVSAVGQYAGLPKRFIEFSFGLAELENVIQQSDTSVDSPMAVPDQQARMLATVVAFGRRRFVADLDEHRELALTEDLFANLDAAKAVFDDLLKAEWYRIAAPWPVPRARDFVAARGSDLKPPAPVHRRPDDKFAVLWSASDLPSDLRVMREECDDRHAPVSVAFVDVDHLKSLNSDLGETKVDALILPPLMRVIERSVFGHGLAYRYGGDEFVVLSPSSSRQVGLAILLRLRNDLANTTFETLSKPSTVSTGLCVVHADAPLTDREVLHWAAMAKREAKTVRNAVAVVEAGRELVMPSIELVDPSWATKL